MSIKVKRSAVEEFLSEALGVTDIPLTAFNAKHGEGGIIVEPPIADVEFVPINTEQLSKSLQIIAKSIPNSDIEIFYRSVKKLMSTLRKKNRTGVKRSTNEQRLRKSIRQIIKEASGWEEEERLDKEDERDARAFAKKEKQTNDQVLKWIAKELGITVSAVSGILNKAPKKLKFIINDLTDVELKDIIHGAVNDFADWLKKHDAINASDVELMKANPEIAAELDSFRVFFAKYIRRAAKAKGVDIGYAPTQKPRGKYNRPKK